MNATFFFFERGRGRKNTGPLMNPFSGRICENFNDSWKREGEIRHVHSTHVRNKKDQKVPSKFPIFLNHPKPEMEPPVLRIPGVPRGISRFEIAAKGSFLRIEMGNDLCTALGREMKFHYL